MSRVELLRGRIYIDGRPRLVLAGEVHYFRLDPRDWADRLGALRDAGCDTVATYLPWVWHEKPDRSTDLGDLVAFLDLAQSLDLWVIARPGPYVMAELQNEGIPPRVALDTPSLVPTTWDGSPVPNATLDLLAPAFLSAVDEWYAAVMPVLAARQVDRGGPIIAVQLDNEVGMLPWVTNAPPFFTSTALPDHISYSRSTRTTFAAYLSALRGLAERHGVTDVPFLINVHGTSDGRARTFGIGLSQLRDSYHGQPGTAAGTDLYLGDLTVTNLPDLWVANAFTAATNGPDQPLTSLEFECGSGDYADDLSVLVPPSAVELKTRLALAQGNRLLNYYLFAGGLNPSRPASAAVPGTSLIAITGKRHGFAAPIDPEGRRTPGYDAIARVLRSVQPYAALIADSQPVHDDVALGLVRDHYLTEYRNPASPERGEQVADLERFRGMGPRDIMARALLLAGYTYPAVDLQTDAALPRVVALGSPRFLPADVQRRLADHVLGGGSLLLSGVLPDSDLDGTPCTILADALGVRSGSLLPASHDYFTSVAGPGLAEVRVGFAQSLSCGGEPLLVEVGSGEPCGHRLTAGAGRAVVLAADYPCHLGFWRDQVRWLGATPGLRPVPDVPGVIAVVTGDPHGRRLIHVLNVSPSPAAFRLGDLRLRLDARAGIILPANLPVGDAVLTSTTCELVALEVSAVILRPTQPSSVAMFDTDRLTADRGRVDGGRVTVTGPEPVRISVG